MSVSQHTQHTEEARKKTVVFVAGNATYKSPCPSVGWSVGHAFTFSMRMAFIAPAKLIIAPAQLITAPAQVITAPAQLITAPAQPPATGAAVYTALFIEQKNLL